MTSQLRSYWCFVDDGLLPRYVMHTTVRFCTSAKQDDVKHLSPAQLAPNEQSLLGSTPDSLHDRSTNRDASEAQLVVVARLLVFAFFKLATLEIADYCHGSAVA
jgi:hypothetical protein